MGKTRFELKSNFLETLSSKRTWCSTSELLNDKLNEWHQQDAHWMTLRLGSHWWPGVTRGGPGITQSKSSVWTQLKILLLWGIIFLAQSKE